MRYAYSILMGAFALALLLYAGIMALTKDYKSLPYRCRASVKPKDEKLYMTQLSKNVALVALAPALSAVIALWNKIVAVVVLILSAILFIWLGTKIMKKAG